MLNSKFDSKSCVFSLEKQFKLVQFEERESIVEIRRLPCRRKTEPKASGI